MIKEKYFNYIDIHNAGCLDFVLCGSDQIWNPQLTGGLNSNYFGVINNARLRAISYISVREKSMVVRLKKYTPNKEIYVSLDPVFLPDGAYWEKLSEKPRYKNYILIYRLSSGNQIYTDAYQLAGKTGKKVVEITTQLSCPDKTHSA